MKHNFSSLLLEQLPIIGILRGFSEEKVIQILYCCIQEGFTTVEITMNTNFSTDIIRKAVAQFGTVLNIGAGTVCTLEELNAALDANAQFIVTPIFQAPVVQACHQLKIPIFVGAYTPTEIFQAWQAGATAVKVFPAAIGGLAYIKAIKEPLHQIPLVPTGGVSAENIAEFLNVGVYALGMGGQLFPKSIIESGDWQALCQQLAKTKAAYENWKKQPSRHNDVSS